MGIAEGKRILITGVAGDLSIATAAAKSLHAHGAKLAFTYQNERLKARVDKIAESLGNAPTFELDVAEDESINSAFSQLNEHWPDGFDGFLHAIAFAPRDLLDGDFIDATNREGFMLAHDISSYSLVALTKAARPMLRENSSIVALTFAGSSRATPNYNAMGPAKASLEASVKYLAVALGNEKNIRINSVSAGAIRTLAASGIKEFKSLQIFSRIRSPLQRCVTAEEVGNTVTFLISDMSSGINGTEIMVDTGFDAVMIHQEESRRVSKEP